MSAAKYPLAHTTGWIYYPPQIMSTYFQISPNFFANWSTWHNNLLISLFSLILKSKCKLIFPCPWDILKSNRPVLLSYFFFFLQIQNIKTLKTLCNFYDMILWFVNWDFVIFCFLRFQIKMTRSDFTLISTRLSKSRVWLFCWRIFGKLDGVYFIPHGLHIS